ncbi:DUF3577 domain-containing protein [Hydromonas duriensis]|uniref:Uncharacterized protein DUF3577 n=1 Tax=Hydromonas duriensis TaxID=1527608 RepID=A0A4R6Y453_9BURK|nr:DUF3577 domain-containing protein [Hydromonas duriensis]TDR27785.1 uncharacterized protein DUF3577 [Hydromonas duriensis]
MTQTTTTPSYFDMTTRVVGYFNRLRVVQGKGKKQPDYLALDFSALNGSSDEPEYRRFNLTVKGAKAKELVEQLIKEFGDSKDTKIFGSVEIGDFYADYWIANKGTPEEEIKSVLKGRLLKVHTIKVDGQQYYDAKTADSQDKTPAASTEDVKPSETDETDSASQTEAA